LLHRIGWVALGACVTISIASAQSAAPIGKQMSDVQRKAQEKARATKQASQPQAPRDLASAPSAASAP
jgi:hypothetical protein